MLYRYWTGAVRRVLPALAAAGLLGLCLLALHVDTPRVRAQQGPPPLPANAQPVASGLLNPRGFTWGPDGAIYVAEAGSPPAGYQPPMGGGPPPMGGPPVTNMNGRISRIAPDGTRTTLVDGLPVVVGPVGDVVGAAAVAFIGNTLYAAISAGPAHGHPDFAGGVYQVNSDGSLTLVADTDAFELANPPAECHHCGTPGDEISNPYDMIALGAKLYITDGNKDSVYVVDPAAAEGNRIARFADLSTLAPPMGHLVLTGIAAGPDNTLYVTNLTSAPFPAGGAGIWRLSANGQATQVASGLSASTGLAIGPDGSLYAVQVAQTPGPPAFLAPPGQVNKVNGDGSLETVAAPLLFPTQARWHDGALYVTNFSIGGNNGEGSILRIAVPAGK